MVRKADFRSPGSSARALEALAVAETAGAENLEAAARRTEDDSLRERLLAHAHDERRHAAALRGRAAALADDAPSSASSPPDLSRGRASSEVDAHGFSRAGNVDESGEIAFVAMLCAAEKRATRLYRKYRRLSAHDGETAAVFDAILEDEKRHVAYTEELLRGWEEIGRAREVSEGRSAARGGRLWYGWTRVGIRSGGSFGRAVLTVFYLLFLWPFGLVARRSPSEPGWRLTAGEDASPTQTAEAQESLRSQY